MGEEERVADCVVHQTANRIVAIGLLTVAAGVHEIDDVEAVLGPAVGRGERGGEAGAAVTIRTTRTHASPWQVSSSRVCVYGLRTYTHARNGAEPVPETVGGAGTLPELQ